MKGKMARRERDNRKRCRHCGCVMRQNPRGAGWVHYGSFEACDRIIRLKRGLRYVKLDGC